MDALVMTGGKGTRMSPLTHVLPKGLLPVGGKPILETIVNQLAFYGFRRITFSCGYLAPLIRTYFGNGEQWDVSLSYIVEEKPLGTIGALRLLPRWKGPLLVLNCDVLTTLNFSQLRQFHCERNSWLTVATQQSRIPIRLGVLETEGDNVKRFVEKPHHKATVSMGIYMMNAEVLPFIPEGRFFDTPDLIRALLASGHPVLHYANDAYWLDIGKPDDYHRANDEYPRIEHRLLPGETR